MTGRWTHKGVRGHDLAGLALDEASIRLAHDRLLIEQGTAREKDEFGRLHVRVSNISKSNICPYYGREIPGYADLGLDPARIYKLWRAPDELLKSLGTWNNVPLLDTHVVTSADEPQKDRVVGSTGTDAEFAAPYLRNSLVVWDGDAIDLVEGGEQKQLSCGYRYTADMTPGQLEGEHYDGVMRNIVGNHVALVREGRAGADVVVGDSKPVKMKGRPMIKTAALRSRKALMAQGALVAFLSPRLAADAQIDLGDILKGVNEKNFKRSRPVILRKLVAATEGKLAADAEMKDVEDALEDLDDVKSGEDAVEEAGQNNSTACDEEEDDKDKAAEDEEDDDKKSAAEDEEEDDKDKARAAGADEEKDMVSKEAMDAAIAKAVGAAVRDTRRSTIAALNAIEAAKAEVRPHVGDLAGQAFDSPSEVYRLALDSARDAGLDISLDGVPPTAYGAMVRLLPKPGEVNQPRRDTLAADSKAAASFAEMFPTAAAVRHI